MKRDKKALFRAHHHMLIYRHFKLHLHFDIVYGLSRKGRISGRVIDVQKSSNKNLKKRKNVTKIENVKSGIFF